MQAAETARSASRPTSDLSSCDLFLRAYALYSSHRMRQALALLKEANAHDPYLGPRPWACVPATPLRVWQAIRAAKGVAT